MRRLVLSMAVAVACSGAGSALLASTAVAGYVDGNGGYVAAIYNVTPYTWTLVAQSAPTSPIVRDQYGGAAARDPSENGTPARPAEDGATQPAQPGESIDPG